jgi:hypothetical protein
MSIRGALRQTDDELAGMFHDSEKGRDLTGPETREYLLDRLAEGKRVLPCSPDCEGFDYQTGCPGHHTD